MTMLAAIRIFITAALTVAVAACSPRQFSVPTSSMAPTIPPGSEVIGDMSAYSSRAPERWDIVIFDPPPFAGQGQLWVMRVVGLPGEQISFGSRGGILINEQPLAPPHKLQGIQWQRSVSAPSAVPIPHPFTVPADSFYVLGDNPSIANDSRFWGAVPRKDISGKVVLK